jgi:transcriptional regulator with XRE-family HTH domain
MHESRIARRELGDFLASRRRLVDPRLAGMAVTGTRRVSGLRREEVSVLSGVSVTWYTWLEQGRDVNPSRQVLNALAEPLRLSDAERRYLLTLGGYPDDTADLPPVMPKHGQTFLDALGSSPAYALTGRWDIVGWNRAYELLYPGVAAVDPADRNLLWLVFTDPSVRELLADWPTDSRRFLAHFRAETGRRVGDPDHGALVEALKASSEPFQTSWDNHAVEGFVSRARHFNHPVLGPLTFEHHQLTFADSPRLQVVAYTAPKDLTAFADYVNAQ